VHGQPSEPIAQLLSVLVSLLSAASALVSLAVPSPVPPSLLLSAFDDGRAAAERRRSHEGEHERERKPAQRHA
jgi:hypothetical protein